MLDRPQQERQFRGDDREKILSARQAAEALFYAETKSHGVCFGSFVVRRGAQTTRVADLVAGADSSANGRGTARAAAGDRRGTAGASATRPLSLCVLFQSIRVLCYFRAMERQLFDADDAPLVRYDQWGNATEPDMGTDGCR